MDGTTHCLCTCNIHIGWDQLIYARALYPKAARAFSFDENGGGSHRAAHRLPGLLEMLNVGELVLCRRVVLKSRHRFLLEVTGSVGCICVMPALNGNCSSQLEMVESSLYPQNTPRTTVDDAFLDFAAVAPKNFMYCTLYRSLHL